MVQWLRLHTSTAGGTGSIPGWGTKILYATWRSQKNKEFGKVRVRGLGFGIRNEFCQLSLSGFYGKSHCVHCFHLTVLFEYTVDFFINRNC